MTTAEHDQRLDAPPAVGLSQNATGMGRMTLAEHVLGLEVVLGDGRILKTGSWATKNTAPFYRYNGPDLTGMFLCDSGAFGIKTKVHLLLEPWPKMSFGCVTFPDRVSLVRAQAAMAQTGLHTEAFAFDGLCHDIHDPGGFHVRQRGGADAAYEGRERAQRNAADFGGVEADSRPAGVHKGSG